MQDCQWQIKTKYEPEVFMLKETAKNGMLLKEYRCMQDATSMNLFNFYFI